MEGGGVKALVERKTTTRAYVIRNSLRDRVATKVPLGNLYNLQCTNIIIYFSFLPKINNICLHNKHIIVSGWVMCFHMASDEKPMCLGWPSVGFKYRHETYINLICSDLNSYAKNSLQVQTEFNSRKPHLHKSKMLNEPHFNYQVPPPLWWDHVSKVGVMSSNSLSIFHKFKNHYLIYITWLNSYILYYSIWSIL